MMWRLRSDIGTLQARDVHFKFDGQADLAWFTLFIRLPKEAQQKHSTLGVLSQKLMCPVHTLFTFMEKSRTFTIRTPRRAYVNNPSKVQSIQPSIVANIVKQAMQEAGIDTQVYGPHSLRSASSTEAVQLGHNIDDIEKHTNWSLSADTFEQIYLKPPHKEDKPTYKGSIFFLRRTVPKTILHLSTCIFHNYCSVIV